MINPSATFILRTSDLPTPTTIPIVGSGPYTAGPYNTWLTVTNSTGSVLAGRSSMTWNNVDIKTIIGTMWEKYDYFMITLVSTICAPIITLSTTINDRSAIVNLQGLQFVNSSYSIATKANIPIVQMGTINMSVANTGSLTQNNFMAGVMFQKADRMVNLTITLTHVADATLLNSITVQNTADAVTINPQQIYQFRIDGVDYKQ